jgi:hypothetical protein
MGRIGRRYNTGVETIAGSLQFGPIMVYVRDESFHRTGQKTDGEQERTDAPDPH